MHDHYQGMSSTDVISQNHGGTKRLADRMGLPVDQKVERYRCELPRRERIVVRKPV
jgi:hypothetical protein